jgi:hypothetical protein
MIVFLLYLPLWLLALLLWVLLRKRAYSSCPYFFVYVAFGVAASVARFIAKGYPAPYYATYWITEAGYCLLGILAMYEVCHVTLGELPRAWWARLIFPVILLTSIGLSLARTNTAPMHFARRLTSSIVVGEIAVRLVQVFIFAGLATIAPLIGLRWRRYPFGVAMGFGLYATFMLLTTTRYADLGPKFNFVWGVSSVAAYSVAVLIWIWFFAVPATSTDPESRTLGPLLR